MTGARHRGCRDRDAGRVSIFLAIGLFGILAVIGLSFDGAGQLRSMQRADNLAAEAARAGGQAIDRAGAIQGLPTELDEAAARAAVEAYLRAAGAPPHQVDFPTEDGQQLIRVRLRLTYQTYMLGLFGFDDEVTVSGEATARPLTA
jgi:hypothetical protein